MAGRPQSCCASVSYSVAALGSSELRDGASQELKGHPSIDNLPTYRVVPAVIRMDTVSGNNYVTGQRIRPGALSDFTHDRVDEQVHLTSEGG